MTMPIPDASGEKAKTAVIATEVRVNWSVLLLGLEYEKVILWKLQSVLLMSINNNDLLINH